MSRLREVLDYLMLLPLATADGLLRAIQPLLKLSSTLRDALVIVLRKAIFCRFLQVLGFLLQNLFRRDSQICVGSVVAQ